MRLIYKNGGSPKRKKAILGLDGAINAAATLTAAAMQVAAQYKTSKEQAQAVLDNAKTNADVVTAQTDNNTKLQEQSMNTQVNLAKEQNDLIKEFQLTNQMVAGNEQNTYRDMNNKIVAKNGVGVTLPRNSFNMPFIVTDGGQAIPLQINNQGYGLYELQGNDHEHYHKTKGGKYKSGVGIKLPTGEVIEGEGNQNTTKGEKIFVTPDTIQFISKHNIKGFNPAEAVDNGMPPQQAFAIQEAIKQQYGISNDGKKMKKGGFLTPNTFTDYHGALYSSLGNLGGAALTGFANHMIGRYMAPKFAEAARITKDAASRMTTIDGDYASQLLDTTGQALAVVRSANTNVNPQLERLRRQTAAQQELIDNNTLSSAARLQRLATVQDRENQASSEIYANKHNMDEKIKQENAERATQVAMQNAELATKNRELVARYNFERDKYNNDINNSKIAMMAQADIDKFMNSANLNTQLFSNSANAMSNAIANTGDAFATAWSSGQKARNEFYNVMSGKDALTIGDSLILRGDKNMARRMFDSRKNSIEPDDIKLCNNLAAEFGFKYKPPTSKGNSVSSTNSNSANNTNKPSVTAPSINTNSSKSELVGRQQGIQFIPTNINPIINPTITPNKNRSLNENELDINTNYDVLNQEAYDRLNEYIPSNYLPTNPFNNADDYHRRRRNQQSSNYWNNPTIFIPSNYLPNSAPIGYQLAGRPQGVQFIPPILNPYLPN